MKIAFDIGANIGKSSLFLSGRYDSIIAVEPIKSCVEKITNLHLSNVTVINRAVSSTIGEVDFYECDTISTIEKSWVENSRFTHNYTWKNPYKVSTTTVDQLVQLYGVPKFIKIDVEGHELNVIQGMSNAYADIIAFEWAEEVIEKTILCIEELLKKGYKKFDVQFMTDELNFIPTWKSYEDVIKTIQSYFTGKKNSWGMIWCEK